MPRLSLFALCLALWWSWPCPVKVCPNSYGVVDPAIKAAIYRMGPGYDYRLEGDTLYVNQGDGWLKLRY